MVLKNDDNLMAEDLKLSVSFGKRKRKLDLAGELRITHDNSEILTEEMSKQPAKYAWYGVLAAMASEAYDRMKAANKAMYAELSKKHRRHRDDLGLKITDKIIESDVEADKKYIDHCDALITARRDKDILNVAVRAFEQRKDMMQSIGGQLKREQEVSVRSLQEKARDRAKRSRKNG
jgi:hypothetical protein